MQPAACHPLSCRPPRLLLAAGVLPMLDLGPLMFGVLGLATLLKLPLWWQCTALKRYSGAAEALAEDHLNDCFSNLGEYHQVGAATRPAECCARQQQVRGRPPSPLLPCRPLQVPSSPPRWLHTAASYGGR